MTAHYKLDDLGWWQFEQLCQALLKATFGPAVIAWGGRGDQGRDAYCEEPLELTKAEKTPGPFVFQVKFVQGASAAGANPEPALIRAVRAERTEIERRIDDDNWPPFSRYVLLTNVQLTSTLRQRIADVFDGLLPAKSLLTWGRQDISDMLHDQPRLRIAFPQLMGIQDLGALLGDIVNRAVLERSEAARLDAQEYARVFVPTSAYEKALEVLTKNHFAVLTGPPEMGKTTIARMIGLAQHTCDWQFFDCSAPNDFFQCFDRNAPQIFVADDAFGTTEYKPDNAFMWGKDLSKILRRLDKTHWLIWTSRPVPLQYALANLHLEGPAERFPHPGQVTVDTANYDLRERALMLYRHAKAADLTDTAKAMLRDVATKVVGHEYLTPERIRRLVVYRLPELSQQKELSKDDLFAAISAEITEPTKRMRQSFEKLDEAHQWLLFAMLDLNADNSLKGVREAYTRLHNTVSDSEFDRLIEQVTDHFLKVQSYRHPWSQGHHITWMHPSWRDLVVERLMSHDPARDKFLRNCGLQGIKLALSIGGGAKGELELPLLRTPADWNALQSNITKIVTGSNRYHRWTVLGMLRDRCKTDVPLQTPAMSVAVCEQLLAHWNRKPRDLDVTALSTFYDLAIKCSTFLPSPPLDELWNTTWLKLDELDESDADQCYADLTDLVLLVEVLKDHEPRYLAVKNFPEGYIQRARKFVLHLNYLGLDLPKDTSDKCEEAKECLEGWTQALEALQQSFDLEAELQEVLSYFDEQMAEVVKAAEDIARKESEDDEGDNDFDNDDWYYYQNSLRQYTRSTPNSGSKPNSSLLSRLQSINAPQFSVDDLFSDL